MPEHLKSLAVITFLAASVFLLVKRPACAVAITSDDFTRRRNVWFAATLIAFLAHNFWIYLLVTGALLWLAGAREKNITALFFLLLFAVPPIQEEITGLGLIKHFFAIHYLRLLSLVILLPAFLALRKRAIPADKPTPADTLLAAYIVLNLLLQLSVDSFTNTLRFAFYAFIDVVLPYYVVSRSLKDLQGFREALMSLVIAALILALIGGFEFGKHWLLYSPLEEALGVQWGYGGYIERDENLRALASTGQPIVLGYVMAVALSFYLFLQKSVPQRSVWLLGFLLLIAGLIAPLSRGPWVGAAIMLFIFVASGPKAVSRLAVLGMVGVLALPILLSTSAGEKIISYLPFVGTIENETVTYRQDLIDFAIGIIGENPLFGSFDFLLFLEELRQGQGIIDLVNSYINIALASGLVGLSLFAAFFGYILKNIYKEMQALSKDDERYLLGRVLLATIIGILVIIFTVSSINVIPVIYWSVAGLGMAYIRLLKPGVPVAVERTK